jgi:hypothetical protein
VQHLKSVSERRKHHNKDVSYTLLLLVTRWQLTHKLFYLLALINTEIESVFVFQHNSKHSAGEVIIALMLHR